VFVSWLRVFGYHRLGERCRRSRRNVQLGNTLSGSEGIVVDEYASVILTKRCQQEVDEESALVARQGKHARSITNLLYDRMSTLCTTYEV